MIRCNSAYLCDGLMGALVLLCCSGGIWLSWLGITQVAAFKPKIHARCRLDPGACVEVCKTPCDCQFELWFNASYTVGNEVGGCLYHIESRRYRDFAKCQSDRERTVDARAPCYVYSDGLCQNANAVDNDEALSGFCIFAGVVLILIAICTCWSCTYCKHRPVELEVPLN